MVFSELYKIIVKRVTFVGFGGGFQCPIHRPPHGLHGLTVLDDETIEWLLNTCPEI